jgi:hypothetical protein
VYSSRGAYPCPLCGQDDSLEHIVLRCPGLAQQRREIWEAAARPFAYGVAPPEGPPAGCTERVRQYLRNYLTMASNLQPDEQEPVLDCSALALWLARPPSLLLSRLDDQLGGVVLSSPELAYLRKELIFILCQLLIGTRNLWRLRCAGAFEQLTEFTAMTCGCLTPKVSLSSQRTISSYFPSLPFSLSLDLGQQGGRPLGPPGASGLPALLGSFLGAPVGPV